jgi:aryl-alcohol dehydrogenase
MPLGRLVRRNPFEEIQTAVADMVSGATVKPVLTF